LAFTEALHGRAPAEQVLLSVLGSLEYYQYAP
jgi:hypothetical protein